MQCPKCGTHVNDYSFGKAFWPRLLSGLIIALVMFVAMQGC